MKTVDERPFFPETRNVVIDLERIECHKDTLIRDDQLQTNQAKSLFNISCFKPILSTSHCFNRIWDHIIRYVRTVFVF